MARTPYLYWKLDDTAATAADTSGNNRPGTYAGTVTRSVTGALNDSAEQRRHDRFDALLHQQRLDRRRDHRPDPRSP